MLTGAFQVAYGSSVLTAPATRLVAASGVSNLGDGVWAAALPLLAAATTSDPLAVAAVFAAGQLPWLAVAVCGGGVVDRTNRVALLRRANALRVALVFVLAVSVAVAAVGVAVLIVAAVVVGACEAMVDTTTEAVVPAIVEPTDLSRVNGRLVAAQITGNELVGPALGGVLFAIGASVPLFANASLLVAAVALLLAVPVVLGLVGTPSEVASMRWRDGFEMLRADARLRAVTRASAWLAAIDAAWFALLVLLVDRQLGVGGVGFGVLLAVGAIGGLLGAALAERCDDLPLSIIGGSAFGVMGLSLLLLALRSSLSTTVVALVLTSGTFAMWNIASTTTRQTIVPMASLGRIAASYRGVVIAAAIGGALIGGWIASIASLPTALALAGIGGLVGAPLVVRSLRSSFAV